MWKKITDNEYSYTIPNKSSLKYEILIIPIVDNNGRISKYEAKVVYKKEILLERQNNNKATLIEDIKKRFEVFFK
jgi:hypothetical protein